MQQIDKEIIATVLIAAILMLLLSIIVILSIIRYQKRQRAFLVEKQTLKFSYEQELLKSRLEMQEQTFTMISQEIHDNVGQVLSLAKVQIGIMKESGQTALLDEVGKNIGSAMSDLRDIARSLNSERIRGISTHAAVAMEAERINKSGKLHAGVRILGEERMLNDQKRLILFRIIQECLQNILKHAQATEIEIVFHYLPAEVQVSVCDNGIGFDVGEKGKEQAGLGLANIRTRTELIGGSCLVESTLRKGTAVRLEIPYE